MASSSTPQPNEPSFDVAQRRLRIGGLAALAALLMGSYSMARPATESLFIEAHGSEGLPLAWLLVAVAATAAVVAYNRVLAGRDLVGLFGGTAAVSAGLLVMLQGAIAADLPGATYALYVWKDVHMVVLVEIFYSFANAVFPIKTARWAYGFFGVIGALGGIAGNLLVGVAAQPMGTTGALWLAVPLLLTLWAGATWLGRRAGHRAELQEEGATSALWESLQVVRRSRYLPLVLVLIATVQLVITLVDLNFNILVEAAYPDKDVRTQEIGFVYAAISAGTVLLHALTGPILRLAGVPLTLLALPLILGTAVASFAAAPAVATVAVAKIVSKVFDYTLFRNGKEILYIPLSEAEKTRGKSVVDMLTYRVAKGAASLLLLALAAVRTMGLINTLTLVLIVVWFAVTWIVVRRFRRVVSRKEELRALG